MSSLYQVPKHFNPQQKEAILLDGNNILVAAAAGCGKTTLLIERIIRKIINNHVDVNQIVVVTFTEAAAGELKERLEKALNDKIDKVDDLETKSFLEKQLGILDDAYISTFHSLCLRLLKENQAEFDFSRPIQIGDNRVVSDIKAKAYQQLFNDCYLEEDFQKLDEYYNKSVVSQQKLQDILYSVNSLVKSKAGYDAINHANKAHNVNQLNDIEPFASFYTENIGLLLTRIERYLRQMFEEDISDKFMANFKAAYEIVKINLKNIETNYDFFKLEPFGKIHNNKYDGVYPAALHTEIKDAISSFNNLIKIDKETLQMIIDDNYKNVGMVLKYAQKLDEYFLKEKKDTGYLEFDDLETLLIEKLYFNIERGLRNDTAKAISEKFNEIMVDEYQDTSTVQEMITKAISKGNNTFMVGDIKQSIYAFRNATAALFASKYELYKKDPSQGTLIELTKNYRSTNNVLETTNFIFKNIFSSQVGGIDYDDTNKLNLGNEDLDKEHSEHKTDLILNTYVKAEKEDRLNRKQEWYASAKTAIDIMQDLVSKNEASYSDFTILTKNRNGWPTIENLLYKAGIQYMAHGTSGFFDTYEIRDLLNLLTFLCNRNDDVALLGVLHSLFFNLNEADLLEISTIEIELEDVPKTLYNKLKFSRFRDVYAKLEELLMQSYLLAPTDLIDYIFENTLYTQRIYSFNNFDNFLINILRIKKVIEESLEKFNTLEKVLFAIQDSLKSNKDDTSTAVISSEEDVVNLMTIHKSKGLEFKYVILLDQSEMRMDELKKENPQIVGDQLILRHYNTDYKVELESKSNPYKDALAFYNQVDTVSEELRILYVALTRAKLKLFIIRTLSIEELDKIVKSSNEGDDWLIPTPILLENKFLSNFAIAALSRHKDAQIIRQPHQTSNNFEILNYAAEHSNLFNLTINEGELLQEIEDTSTKKEAYPYQVVSPLDNEIKKTFQVKPSFHEQDMLNFDVLSKVDTFKQGLNAHYILETIDFEDPNYEAILLEYKIKSTIDSRLYDGLLAFFKDPFFNTIKDNSYHKEYAFLYNKDNKLIRGIIDLLVETDDTVYIIDYKSDQLTQNQLVSAYSEQLTNYAQVIAYTTSKPIKKKIYSIHNHCFIDVN